MKTATVQLSKTLSKRGMLWTVFGQQFGQLWTVGQLLSKRGQLVLKSLKIKDKSVDTCCPRFQNRQSTVHTPRFFRNGGGGWTPSKTLKPKGRINA